MPTSGLNLKCHDGQININAEKFANNVSSENSPENVPVSSSIIALPSDNNSSENNISAPQVPVKDDERDLIELMIASSTIPAAPANTGSSVKTKSDKTSGSTGGSTRSDAKKRAKQQRDLSRDLALLFPDNNKVEEEKAFSFAQAYFLKVRDRLDEHSFLEFVKVLSCFDNRSVTVCDLYHKIISILEPHSELSEEFVAFLLPEQAMELGVYMEYLCFTKMKHFLRKLEVYFNKQPQQVRKIYECLARLADQSATSKIDMSTVRSVMLPLLKGSSLLTEYFLQLFPFEQPPVLECSDNKDFEKVDCGEFDESSSGVQHEDVDTWDWETVEIPDLEDPFGGDSCPCSCHNNSLSSASAHCFSCGIKFINGRVFVQNGKVLRPAKLVIEGVNKKEIIERIGKKSSLKNDDDKSGSSLKHRKRSAADSSPVKNNCGNSTGTSVGGSNGNSSLLSPTGTESEEDVSDFKLPSAKVRSPRTIKSGNILKISHNKTVTNKDTEKDNTLLTESEIFNARSFVLLDSLSVVNESKKEDSPSNLQEDIGDLAVNSESCESEAVDVGSNLNDTENDVPELSAPEQSSGCIESVAMRDDEDDDIEYIEIDDDDADDDVDVVIEDDDDDDDIEEDEEEAVHNEDDEEDYEDIEVVEIDEDEERDMDIDYLTESNDDEVSHRDDTLNDKSCVASSICDKKTFECKDSDISDKDITVKIENTEEILIENVKSEVVEDDFNDESNSIQPELSSSDCKLSPTESQVLNSVEQSAGLVAEVTGTDVKESPMEVSLSTPSPPSSHLPSSSAVSTSSSSSSSSSWTKEEDKVILQTFQQEGDSDENFITIRKQLPQRSVEEIKSRFNILMQLLKRMTTNKNSIE